MYKKVFYIPKKENEITENFWAIKVGLPLLSKKYKVDNILFFNKELVYGDIIKITRDKSTDKYLYTETVVESIYSSILVTCLNNCVMRDIEKFIKDLQCETESMKYKDTIVFATLVSKTLNLKTIVDELQNNPEIKKAEVLVNRHNEYILNK